MVTKEPCIYENSEKNKEKVFDFSTISKKPFHGGADLNLMDDFMKALSCTDYKLRTSIENSVESRCICYEAERSRLIGKTISLVVML